MSSNYFDDLKGRLVSQKLEIAKESLKTIPAWAVVSWNWLAAFPLEKWATAVVIGYTLTQWLFLVRDRRKERREKE